MRIPSNMCCLAHVKTSLCNEGLLTLNTGIIDPDWNGRVSSFILNFGKDELERARLIKEARAKYESIFPAPKHPRS